MSEIHPVPIIGQCVVCKKEFNHPRRIQGGGRVKKYCSHNCVDLAWRLGNPKKRTAVILAYDSKPENKEKRRSRQIKYKLEKYGLTQEKFDQELIRQNFSCYGCLKPLTKDTARLDHDHRTKLFRGLLCNNCNWTLGHAKDTPMLLRRLMSYLDRDRRKVMIYITGALKNERIPIVGNHLRNLGFDVMDEWFTPGELADINWQKYEKLRGRNYSEALRGRSATNIFSFDRSYIDLADIIVMIMPAGKSAAMELGYAKGRGKLTCILLDGTEPEKYEVMPNFANEVFKTENDLVKFLSQKKIEISQYV
jgi:Recombination endonuclease VII